MKHILRLHENHYLIKIAIENRNMEKIIDTFSDT